MEKQALEAVARAAAALRQTGTIVELVPVIGQAVTEMLAAPAAALLLADAQRSQFVIEAGFGSWQVTEGRRLPLESVLGITLLNNHKPVILAGSDRPADAFFVTESGQDFKVLVCVPLRASKRFLGALCLGQTRPPSDVEQLQLVIFSDMVANVIARVLQGHRFERELSEATQVLQESRQQLQEMEEVKTQFIDDVSHELRTPVSNLSLYLHLLENGPPKKRERYLTTIQEQISKLERLMQDVLSFAEESGENAAVDYVAIDLNDLVRQVLASQRRRVEMAGLSLNFEPAPDLQPILGDPEQLGRVIGNLLTNAINYTPEGGIEVRTRLSTSWDQVCLDIEDSGIGILPGDIDNLFDRFFRGRNTNQDYVPGAGLGLTVAAQIVEEHGGKIEVSSHVGQGSIFQVKLPVAVTNLEIVPEATLLVVDNSKMMQGALRDILEQAGYNVIMASDGEEALDILEAFTPDLIISDVVMPGMDGFAFFDVVRAHPEWKKIPFTFLTGQSEQQDLLATKALLGANYLFKPVVSEELLEAVRGWLGRMT